MSGTMLTKADRDATSPGMRIAALVGSLLLGACVQVQAPDEPIEINLNVNIKQEVVYRLQEDAENLIEENPELFPQ